MTGKFGLDVPIDGPYADPFLIADMAQEAEQAGWDGFFIQDFIYSPDQPILDPIVTLAAIALKTQTIRLGAFMTALPRRRPWKLARELATLDLLSGGRIIMGVGLGFQDQEFISFGEEGNLHLRAEKLDEALALIEQLWKGAPIHFAGKHYQVDLPVFLPQPVQKPRIPIWVSGGWPRRKPFLRAAHWDGIYVMTINQVTNERLKPEEVRQVKEIILAERSSKAPFDIAVNSETPADNRLGAEIVQPYLEAGATWCVELAPDDPQDYRKRIQAGPPKIKTL